MSLQSVLGSKVCVSQNWVAITLCQSGGGDYAHLIGLSLPILLTFRRPCEKQYREGSFYDFEGHKMALILLVHTEC